MSNDRPDPDPDPDQELSNALTAMAAEVRHENAVGQRWRQTAQGQLAAEESRFAGLLRDVAERGIVVTLDSASGRRHRGTIEAVGRDYCVINSVIVSARAVVAVQLPGLPLAASPRESPTGGQSLSELLTDWAADRVRIRIWVTGQPVPKGGQLYAVGADMVSLTVDEQTIAVPLSAIVEVSNP